MAELRDLTKVLDPHWRHFDKDIKPTGISPMQVLPLLLSDP
jgi:hypothetical protein